jgi:hypothetical protein
MGCRFRNISDQPGTISLPDYESSDALLKAPSGIEVRVRRASDEAVQTVQGHFLKSPDFCRQGSEKMDSNVKCEPSGTPTTLRPGEEFVRTIAVRLSLGGLQEFVGGIPPGKYRIEPRDSKTKK